MSGLLGCCVMVDKGCGFIFIVFRFNCVFDDFFKFVCFGIDDDKFLI